jgi:hypothetical protein
MMITARRDERRLAPVTLRQRKAEDAAVKAQRPLQVGDLEMHVLRDGWCST